MVLVSPDLFAVINCSSFILKCAATRIGGAQGVLLGSSFKRGRKVGINISHSIEEVVFFLIQDP